MKRTLATIAAAVLVTLATIATPQALAAPETPPPPKEAKADPVAHWANVASSEELQRVKGIGPVIASRIEAARPFKTAADVRAVKGIGMVIADRIAGHVFSGGEE